METIQQMILVCFLSPQKSFSLVLEALDHDNASETGKQQLLNHENEGLIQNIRMFSRSSVFECCCLSDLEGFDPNTLMKTLTFWGFHPSQISTECSKTMTGGYLRSSSATRAATDSSGALRVTRKSARCNKWIPNCTPACQSRTTEDRKSALVVLLCWDGALG